MADLHNPKVQKILQSKQFAHVATIRPDGSPQSSPMWFVWDGAYLKFTHATNRQCALGLSGRSAGDLLYED